MTSERPDLPGNDHPSAEVLDELLRAFSIDTDDPAHRDIDVTSAEVAELLTPAGPVEPAGGAPPAPPSDAVGPPDTTDETVPMGDDVTGEVGPPPDPLDPALDPPVAVPPDVAALDAPAGLAEDDDGPELASDQLAADDVTGTEVVADELAGDDVTEDDGVTEPGQPLGADGAGADEVRAAEEVPDDGTGPQDELSPAEGVIGDPFLGGRARTAPCPPAPAGGPGTISIVDDELPDPVQVDGTLSPGGGPVVIIEDRPGDATGQTMSVEEAAAATKIEPRLRDRRIAVKRAVGRKRLKWFVAATVLIVLVVGGLAVVGSGLFAVERVRVDGDERTSAEELAPIIDDLEGTPVLLVDRHAVERQVEALPWVLDARVTTRFPHSARIEIRERVPAATFQGPDGQWRLIDDRGRVLELSAEAPPGYLPITGDGFPDVAAGAFGPPGLGDAATLARSLTPAMLARVVGLSVAPDRSDLRMLFGDGTEVRFGPSNEGLVQKLVRLETTLNTLGDETVSYIDVSTNEVGTG